MTGGSEYPGGAAFAFTIFDDTDVATVANVEPLYRLLESLGMRTTKTVWPLRCDDIDSDFAGSESLDDAHYRDFVVDLQSRGFEIAFHGARMESSARDQTIRALERFREVFGTAPRAHANHSFNRENIYWGVDRVDHPLIRALYGAMLRLPRDYYQGHRGGSPFWWGDLSAQIDYVRNLTFNDINVLRMNPSMPYRDARRPFAGAWFSAADADNADDFVRLLAESNQSRLEAERGACIVATHFGKGFCVSGRVRDDVERALTRLARRRGWFVPVSPLLDYLRARRRGGDGSLPSAEWRRMQWRWARDVVIRRLAAFTPRWA
jgi:hypothetical protein